MLVVGSLFLIVFLLMFPDLVINRFTAALLARQVPGLLYATHWLEGRPEDAHLLQGGDLRAPGETTTAVLLVEAQAEEVVVPQCLDELMTFR